MALKTTAISLMIQTIFSFYGLLLDCFITAVKPPICTALIFICVLATACSRAAESFLINRKVLSLNVINLNDGANFPSVYSGFTANK